MLKIRSEQIEAFQPVSDQQFARRVVDQLRSKHPEIIVRLLPGPTLVNRIPEDRLLIMVEQGIERARSYGLTWESSITGFVVLMFRVAPNFDQQPAINRVLTDQQFAGDARIQKLVELTNTTDWWQAKERYDPGAWQLKRKGAGE